MKAGLKLPDVTFQTRVRDESVGGPNPYRWQPVTTDDYFAGKRVVLKWPRKGPPMPGLRAPSHQIVGKTLRYDVFMTAAS